MNGIKYPLVIIVSGENENFNLGMFGFYSTGSFYAIQDRHL